MKDDDVIAQYQRAVGDGAPKSVNSKDMTEVNIKLTKALEEAKGGEKTINEIRAGLGLASIEGGDRLPNPIKEG